MKAPTGLSLREIADTVGVSVSTVSRALNGSDRVSTLTKDAVREAIAGLTTRQGDGSPGTVATRPLLGLIHSHYSGSRATHGLDIILEQVLAGVEVACLRHGYIPYPWQQSRLLMGETGEPFLGSVAGVVVIGGMVERDLVARLQERGLPLVIVGGHLPGVGVASVAADGMGGMYAATRHLLELGHRHIGLVNGPAETYTSLEKRAGYLAALTEAGLASDPALIAARDGYTGFEAPTGVVCTEELLALPTPPTAILYASDALAEAGYRVLQRRGLRVPEDLSIVGFHDDHSALHLPPPLTSVRVSRSLWGEVAADRLLAALGGEALHGARTLLPTELIVRESTGPLRV